MKDDDYILLDSGLKTAGMTEGELELHSIIRKFRIVEDIAS